MIGDRKDDHVRRAAAQQHQPTGHSEFDKVSFAHHALTGTDRSEVSLATRFAGTLSAYLKDESFAGTFRVLRKSTSTPSRKQ